VSDKLHPAAMRAAEDEDTVMDLEAKLPFAEGKQLLGEVISRAIDDHLKSEGWLELEKQVDHVAGQLRELGALPWSLCGIRLRAYLRDVRGEK